MAVAGGFVGVVLALAASAVEMAPELDQLAGVVGVLG
jgi:hypothetical protein